MASAEFIGFAHLCFQSTPAAFELDAVASAAQTSRERESSLLRRGAKWSDEYIWRRREITALSLQQHDKAFHSDGKTNAWNGWSAKLFNQSVVTSAATDGILRTKPLGKDFE